MTDLNKRALEQAERLVNTRSQHTDHTVAASLRDLVAECERLLTRNAAVLRTAGERSSGMLAANERAEAADLAFRMAEKRAEAAEEKLLAEQETSSYLRGCITELEAECEQMRGALEALVKDCPDCGGEGRVYLMGDETEIDQPPGSSGRDCQRCAEARQALAGQSSAVEPLAEGREHLTTSGKFRSDKYPWCRDDFVPLKVTDKMAADLLAEYAKRRSEIDAEFGRDLLEALGGQPSAVAEAEQRIGVVYGTNSGHGHVWERPDGIKARCGGPGICNQCSRDAALAAARDGGGS